jgi:hypothetical protein
MRLSPELPCIRPNERVFFSVVTNGNNSKLAKLTRQTVVAPEAELDQANRDLFKEMEAEWEEDWAEL